MPARPGWLVVGGGLALVVAGRIAGLPELIILGCAGLLLVVAAVLWARLNRLRPTVERTIRPLRVHVGDSCHVDLRVHNPGRHTSHEAELHDEVAGTEGARVWVGPLAPGDHAEATYRLPTTRRGPLRVGPLTMGTTDPFGLAHRRQEVVPASTAMVLPHVDSISPTPGGGRRDARDSEHRPQVLAARGDDVSSLRRYVHGDDLRLVNWPATARTDQLMVRQEEQDRMGRVTVLADTRRRANTDESLELVISAAASVLTAHSRQGESVRLLTSGGFDSGFGSGPGHLDDLLDELARLHSSEHTELSSALSRVGVDRSVGAVVLIVADATEADLDTVRQLPWYSRQLTVVVFDRSSWSQRPGAPAREAPGPPGGASDPAEAAVGAPLGALAGITVVEAHIGLPFPAAWQDAVPASPTPRAVRP